MNRSCGPVSKEFLVDAELHAHKKFTHIGIFNADLLMEWLLELPEGEVTLSFLHNGESGLLVGNAYGENVAGEGLVER